MKGMTRGRWTETKITQNVEAPAAAGVQQLRGTTRIPTSVFPEDNLRSYMDNIELWREVCELEKHKQGIGAMAGSAEGHSQLHQGVH